MANDSFKIRKSLNIQPVTSPTLDSEGDVGFDSTSHKIQVYDSTATRNVVTEDGTASLSNKTLLDTTTSIGNTSDTTKKLLFDLSGATSGTRTTLVGVQTTNRTWTFPDSTDAFVGTGTAQTIQNKTLDNTNTVTLKDTLFTLQDNSDTTKQALFELSGITTGNTRTYTLPDASTTVVGTGTTQTLSNKTLDNTSTITVKDNIFTLQDNSDTTKQAQFELSGITTGNTRTYTLPDATTGFVGTGTTQTLSNKTLDNTNTITVKDTLLTVQDNSDTTKQMVFELSGITTGTTRTLTVPDANIAIVGTDNAQTLTNKTIDADSNTITNIENADIKAGAAIARNKLASGTASHVLINDGSGVMSSEALLAQSRGGTGVNNGGTLNYGSDNVTFVTSGATNLTLPTSGTVTTNAGSVTLTNKTIDADSNTITNIENADIKAGAAIARNKLASGTASYVLVNDGSGVMSEESSLATTRGGTALTSYTTGDLLYASASNTLSKRAIGGTEGGVLTVVSGVPNWSNRSLISDWASYSSINSSWSNVVVSYSGFYKRIGDSICLRVGLRMSNTVSGTLNFTQAQLFGSLSINVDTSKLPTQTDNRISIGTWVGYDNGANIYGGEVMFNIEGGANDFYLFNNSNNTVSNTTPFTWNNTDSLSIDIQNLPITEWDN
jgi:hypothetical protein